MTLLGNVIVLALILLRGKKERGQLSARLNELAEDSCPLPESWHEFFHSEQMRVDS